MRSTSEGSKPAPLCCQSWEGGYGGRPGLEAQGKRDGFRLSRSVTLNFLVLQVAHPTAVLQPVLCWLTLQGTKRIPHDG